MAKAYLQTSLARLHQPDAADPGSAFGEILGVYKRSHAPEQGFISRTGIRMAALASGKFELNAAISLQRFRTVAGIDWAKLAKPGGDKALRFNAFRSE